MEVKTKFNVGDKVITIVGKDVKEVTISSITIQLGLDWSPAVRYSMKEEEYHFVAGMVRIYRYESELYKDYDTFIEFIKNKQMECSNT